MSPIMSRIVIVAALAFTILPALPAQAQNNRSFVSGTGLDSNNCTFAAPCRSFSGAYTKTNPSGEIDVLDPAGYGLLIINKPISIQAHGFGGITATSGPAVSIAAGSSDAVTLNGLLIDGVGTGQYGIDITTAGSVQIINCVIRHFSFGIYYGPTNNPANFLVSNTIASDNSTTEIVINPVNGVPTTPVTLSGITANNNQYDGVAVGAGYVMMANSVLSNNSNTGLESDGGTIWLAKSVISGNHVFGVNPGGTVNSYVDNDINGNGTDINGSVTPVTKQ